MYIDVYVSFLICCNQFEPLLVVQVLYYSHITIPGIPTYLFRSISLYVSMTITYLFLYLIL